MNAASDRICRIIGRFFKDLSCETRAGPIFQEGKEQLAGRWRLDLQAGDETETEVTRRTLRVFSKTTKDSLIGSWLHFSSLKLLRHAHLVPGRYSVLN